MVFLYKKKTLFNLIFMFTANLAFTRKPGLHKRYLNNGYMFHWISGNRGQFVNYRHLHFLGEDNERIVGGHSASIKDYPFTAYLAIRRGDFRGGAAIVSSYWAITAAHCMQYISDYEIEQRLAYVRGGTTFWKFNYTQHFIVKSIVHKQYDSYRTDYDIALLKVEKRFYGKYEKPIRFVGSNYEHVAGSTVTVLGWGSTDATVTSISDELKYVDVNLVEHHNCSELIGEDEGTPLITHRMICAIAPGKDACIYDSGGPLIQNGLLIGLVSWGPHPCADPVRPGVYVKVGYFSRWIKRTIKRNLR